MNERAKLAQTIVQAIEEFPKVHKFLTSGDTGCHPQHLVDTIAKRIVESKPAGETLRENILTGFAAELKAMLDEALEKNVVLVYALRIIALSYRERIPLDYTPDDFALLALQFVGEDFDQIPDEEMLQSFESRLMDWLKQNRGVGK